MHDVRAYRHANNDSEWRHHGVRPRWLERANYCPHQGGPIDAWGFIWDSLKQEQRVIAYNRLGVDGSSKTECSQSSSVVVAALRMLLSRLAIAPPFLLVGHSLGGLHANLFARQHPAEVCGIVLLDATAPDDIALMKSSKGALARTVERGIDALLGKDTFGETVHTETSADQIYRAGPFPDIPVVVVTGSKLPMNWLMPRSAIAGRAANQAALSKLSPRGQQIVGTKSGHFPQLTEPALVLAAIASVVRSCQVSSSYPR